MQTYLTDLYNRIEEEHKKIGVFRNLKFSEKDFEAVEKLHYIESDIAQLNNRINDAIEDITKPKR